MPMDPSNIQPQQEAIIPQSEVEHLLAQAGGGDSPAVAARPGEKKDPPPPSATRPYRFRELSSLSAGELRKLKSRHEAFIESLATRLSIHLRLEVSLQMSKLETAHYHKFMDGIVNPTYLAMLKLEPLQGICLLDIPPKLGLCIVDRELGGPAQCLEDARVLSEIEARLLSRVVEIINSEWCSAWSDLLSLRPALLGYENGDGFAQTCPPETIMLILGMEARVGETTGQIQMGFPCATLEPLILKLNAGVKIDKPRATLPAAALKWNPALNDVNIKVTAELPNLELTARQLAQIKPGDTLMITPEMAKQVRVCLAKKSKFIANLGTCNQRWAAKIVRVLNP